jgi:hypothetical protein
VPFIVHLFESAPVADDGPIAAQRASPGQQGKGDLGHRFGQCDKKNHGWREGRPLTVAAKFRSADRPSPSRYSQLQTKKEYRVLTSLGGYNFGPFKTTIHSKAWHMDFER